VTDTTAAPALAEPADMLRLIDNAGVLALDLETTGLNPRTDRVRLLSLHDGKKGLVMDCFQHDLRQLLPALGSKILICHNALFDLSFLWNMGLTELPETICTYLLAQLVTAGEDNERGFGRCGLAACCKRWLDRDLDKTLQTSDWSKDLSAEQIAYAARDTEVLVPLYFALAREIEQAGLVAASEVELRCLPAWIWLSQSGVPFDRQAWLALATQAEANKAKLALQLDDLAPGAEPDGLFGKQSQWNWSSPQQVQTVLGRLGHDVTTTCDAQLALIPGDFAARMRDYRKQEQRVKTFGTKWLANADIQDGRLYCQWRQIGTVTGRTSCAAPNLEQIPRAPGYRACFRALPGKRIVKADFSQLQMRLACRWAQDDALFRIFAAGLDTHTQTAKNLTGNAEPTKVERQIAKSANFLLTYGGSAEALRIYCSTTFGLLLTKQEAEKHRSAFFAAYPGLAAWHRQAFRDNSKEIRSLMGRRRIAFDGMPPTMRLNTPCQADEACGAKLSLGKLWRERGKHPSARLVLFGHDEICIEVDEEDAVETERWLVEVMRESMQPILEPVPCIVEGKIAASWGGD
jgi:DNA polymerase-1